MLKGTRGLAGVPVAVLAKLSMCEAAAVEAASAQELQAVAAALVTALQLHGRSHVVLAQYACAALGNLALLSAVCAATARARGGLQAVLDAMRAHTGDAPCVGSGCVALGSLGGPEEETRRAAGAAGAIEALLEASQAHPQHAGVQVVMCDALQQLIKDCAANASRACAAGGMERVVTALHTLTEARDRKLWIGCRAVWMLLDAADAERSLSVPQADVVRAIQAVVAAMDALPDDAAVQQEGCGALHLLMETPTHCIVAGNAGAVRAVVRSLFAAAAAADVPWLTSSCNALARVCEGLERNQAEAVAAGATPVVIAILSAHRAHDALQRAGVDALLWLANVPRDHAPDAIALLEAVVAAMHADAASGFSNKLQMYGCAAIFAGIKLNQGAVEEHALACGGISAVMGVINRSPRVDEEIFSAAVHALDALTHTETAAHEAAVVRAGALEAILEDGRPVGARMEEDFMPRLRAAAQRHDAAPCAHADCARCAAAARAGGSMCALAGCSAATRAGAGDKRLLRCARCRTAAYCCEAHQRSDWGRHKRECRTLAAARGRANEE